MVVSREYATTFSFIRKKGNLIVIRDKVEIVLILTNIHGPV